MNTADGEISKKLTEVIESLQSWFTEWFRGTIPLDSIDKYAGILHQNWILVNINTPKIVNDKNTFLKVFPTFHGNFKDKTFEQKREILSIKKLAGEYYIVTSVEITKIETETRKRAITEIYQRDEISGEFQLCYVHE